MHCSRKTGMCHQQSSTTAPPLESVQLKMLYDDNDDSTSVMVYGLVFYSHQHQHYVFKSGKYLKYITWKNLKLVLPGNSSSVWQKRFQETSPAWQKPQAIVCLLQGLFCALNNERANVGCGWSGSRKDETCEKRMVAFNFQPCTLTHHHIVHGITARRRRWEKGVDFKALLNLLQQQTMPLRQ